METRPKNPWNHLEELSHQADIQAQIGQLIRERKIRVSPGPDGEIRIVARIDTDCSARLPGMESLDDMESSGNSRHERDYHPHCPETRCRFRSEK